MTLRSVLEVDVRDDRFKQFQALFEKYQQAVTKLPAQWRQSSAAQQDQVKGFRDMAAAMMAQNELVHRLTVEEARGRQEVERTATAWAKIKDHTASAASSIARGLTSFAKWSGLALLGGGVGLFGLDRLGASAGAMRQRSAGLGVSPGEARAFGLNFGRFVSDPGGLLSSIAGARYDVTNPAYAALRAAGISPQTLSSANSANIGVELLQRLPQLLHGVPENLRGTKLHALGLDQLISTEEANKYLSASPEERAAQAAHYRVDAGRLNLGDQQGRAYQDFTTQLSRAAQAIETSLMRSLVGLAGPIDHLSAAVVRTIDAFGKSDQLKHVIDSIGDGLEHFAKYIDTPEFRQGVEDFARGVEKIGSAIASVVKWFGGAPASSEPTGRRLLSDKPLLDLGPLGSIDPQITKGSWLDRATRGPLNNPGNLRIPGSAVGFQQFPDVDSGVRAMARQLQLYAKRDHLDTVEGIVSKYAPPSENDTKAYIGDVAKRTGFAPGQHLDLNDRATLARLIDAMIHHEGTARQVPGGEGQVVRILDNTGGNVVVSTSQTAVPQ